MPLSGPRVLKAKAACATLQGHKELNNALGIFRAQLLKLDQPASARPSRSNEALLAAIY
jgi:hypothetical protein